MTWYGYSALSLGRHARRAAGCGAVLIAAWLVATPTSVYGIDPAGWLSGGNTPPNKNAASVRIPGTKSASAKVENRYQLPTAKTVAPQPINLAKATSAKLTPAKPIAAAPINLVSANRPVSNIGPIPAAPASMRQLPQPAQRFSVSQPILGHGQIMGGPDHNNPASNGGMGNAPSGWNGQRPWAGPSPYAHNNPWAGQWPVPYGGYIYSPAACDYTPPCVMNLWDGYCQRPLRCNPLGSHGCNSCGTGNCGGGHCGTGGCGSGGCGMAAGGCASCGSGMGNCGKVRAGLPVLFSGHYLGRSATCDSCNGDPVSAGSVHATGTPTPAALAPPSVDEGQHVPAESLYKSGDDIGPIPASPTPTPAKPIPAEAKPMEPMPELPMPESVPEVTSPAVPSVPKVEAPKVDSPKEALPAPSGDEDLLPKPKDDARAARFNAPRGAAPRSLYNRPVGSGLPTLSAPR